MRQICITKACSTAVIEWLRRFCNAASYAILLFDGIEMATFLSFVYSSALVIYRIMEVNVRLSFEWSFEKGLELWFLGLIDGGPLTTLLFTSTEKNHEEPQLR